MKYTKTPTKWPAFLFALLVLAAAPVSARDGDRLQAMVDAATTTLTGLASMPNSASFKKHIGDARGMLIVPSLSGTASAGGIMLARVPGTRKWSYPAFYSFSPESLGLPAGIKQADLVLLIMSDKAMKAMLDNRFRSGLDVNVAAGSGAAAGADILYFSNNSGLSDGLNLQRAAIAVSNDWNKVYYGKAVNVADIMTRHRVQVAGADRLRKAAAGAAR